MTTSANNAFDEIPELEAPNVKMRDKNEVYRKLKSMIESGKDKLQVITDFDRTLSKFHHNGEAIKSSYNVFENIPTLPREFHEGTTALYTKFRKIEDDPKMTVEEKLPYMKDWWRSSEKLYIGIPCTEEMITQAVVESNVHLRTGSCKAFVRLKEAKVPILVFSAGLGNVVTAILKHNDIFFDNVHVVSNFFNIENDKIMGFSGTLIHIYNKNQHAIENSSYFQELSHRPNVILMGDSLGDCNMDEGVHGDRTVIKIGFLSLHVEEFLPQYLEHFDIVLCDDQSMDVLNAFLDRIL